MLTVNVLFSVETRLPVQIPPPRYGVSTLQPTGFLFLLSNAARTLKGRMRMRMWNRKVENRRTGECYILSGRDVTETPAQQRAGRTVHSGGSSVSILRVLPCATARRPRSMTGSS